MPQELLCKAIMSHDGTVKYESAKTQGLTLLQIIEDDKKYGNFSPANGKYFTYTVLEDDQEFTEKQIHKAIRYAWWRWSLYTNLPKLVAVPKNYEGIIDIRLSCRTVESDEDKQLTRNTIMYAYYPIHNTNNKFRGLIVVNKDFFFTTHGNSISGEEMIRGGVLVQFPNGRYGTIDFDQVLGHEFGHVSGLSHDSESGQIMSTPHDAMNEFPQSRDQARIQAKKYGKSLYVKRKLERLLRWLKSASDRK